MALIRSGLPRLRDESQRSNVLISKSVVLQVFLLLSLLWNFYLLHALRPIPHRLRERKSFLPAAEIDTLVVYAFRNIDPESWNNFFYFVAHGISEDDGARYLVGLDPLMPESETPPLPELPGNAEYFHPPACFEVGTFGWTMYDSGLVDISNYKYFLWVSAGVKGPFLPAYVSTPWHRLLTKKLTADVKLVGPTISCSTLLLDSSALQHPHVQNYVAATDKIGLGLMKKSGALDCHNTWLDNVRYTIKQLPDFILGTMALQELRRNGFQRDSSGYRLSEFAASAAILNGRYNLDSLMLRYQNINWRDSSNWKCNGQIDPLQQGVYDGTSVNPLEAIFLRVDIGSVVVEVAAVTQAMLYANWAEAYKQSVRNISQNSWLPASASLHGAVMARPPACFDAEFYTLASPFEFRGFTPEQAYEHFRNFGFREGRPYLFAC